MARQRADWQQIMDDQATGDGLSTSGAAEWSNLQDTSISVAMGLENSYEIAKDDINLALDTKQIGSIYWIPLMVKAFQYGDDLIVDNGTVKYATINAENLIVAVVSVKVHDDGSMDIKVAKMVDDELVAFDNDELTALIAYLKKRILGARFVASSRSADVVKYTLNYEYDSLYAKANIETAIDAAIADFRLNYQTPNGYDGLFYKEALEHVIKSVPGVKNLTLRIDMTLSNGTSVTDMAAGAKKEMPAGYFNWDETSTKVGTPA